MCERPLTWVQLIPLTEAETSSKSGTESPEAGRASLDGTGADAHPHMGNAGMSPSVCRNLRRERESRDLVRILDIDQCGCSGFFAAASRCNVISCSACGLRPVRA